MNPIKTTIRVVLLLSFSVTGVACSTTATVGRQDRYVDARLDSNRALEQHLSRTSSEPRAYVVRR